MERQHNALSDELWGDELSLAKVVTWFVWKSASWRVGKERHRGLKVEVDEVYLWEVWGSNGSSERVKETDGNLKCR